MINVKFFLLLSLVSSVTLTSELDPYRDSYNNTLAQIARHANIDSSLIQQYSSWVIDSSDITKIEPIKSPIKGAESYKATLINGAQIFATYYHCGPDKGRACVYIPVVHRACPSGEFLSFNLPIHLSNFGIIKYHKEAK